MTEVIEYKGLALFIESTLLYIVLCRCDPIGAYRSPRKLENSPGADGLIEFETREEKERQNKYAKYIFHRACKFSYFGGVLGEKLRQD